GEGRVMGRDVAGRMRVDFLRHSSGVRRGKSAPRPAVWTEGVLRGAFGAPSAGLSLVGLRPRRAQLRFTRRAESSHDATRDKINGPGLVKEACPGRCTPEPRWDRFARRCGTVSRADYHRGQFGFRRWALRADRPQPPDPKRSR